MADAPRPLFAFTEPDHLIRIHLRMALEDAGFSVEEDGLDLAIVPEKRRDAQPVRS